MFARVQTFHQPTEKLDELMETARAQLPTASELTGFEGFYFLVDRENQTAMVISMWQSQEDLQQVEPHGAASVRDEGKADVGVEAPPAQVFEVALSASRR